MKFAYGFLPLAFALIMGCSSESFSGDGKKSAAEPKKSDDSSKVDEAAKQSDEEEQPVDQSSSRDDDEMEMDEASGEACKFFLTDEDGEGDEQDDVEGLPIKLKVKEYVEDCKGKKECKFRFSLWRHYVNDTQDIVFNGNSPVKAILDAQFGTYFEEQQNTDQVEIWFDGEVEKPRSKNCKAKASEVPRDKMETLIANHALHNSKGRGCFAPTTRIRMADGSDRSIAYVKEGDFVYDPIAESKVKVKRVTAHLDVEADLFEVRVGMDSVLVTPNHPFVTERGVKRADHLVVTDRILGEGGEYVNLSSIGKKAQTFAMRTVYNLELDAAWGDEQAHQVMANGVVAGDLHLQEMMIAPKEPSLVSRLLALLASY